MRYTKTFILAGVAACMPLGIVARAQEASGDAAADEIVVTATKREKALDKVPIAVDVFSGDYLQKNKVQDFSDLSKSISNLIAPDGVAGAGVVSLRGISSSARAAGGGLEQPVGVFVDGVAAPNALGQLIFDTERVEVIRGPQGAIWGRNTLAGAISFTSSRPTSDVSGYAQGSIGNYKFADFRAALSGTLAGDSLRGRIAFAHDQRDGYVKRLSGGTTGSVDRYAVRGTLAYDPVDAVSVTLIGQYDHSEGYNDVPEYLSGPFAALAGTNGFQRVTDVDFYQPGNSETVSVTGLVDWKLGEFTLSSVTGYRKGNSISYTDSDGTAFDILRETVGGDTKQFSQELRLTRDGALDGLLDLMLGAAYLKRSDYTTVVAPEEGVVFAYLGFDNDIRSVSGFGSADFHLTDWLTLNSGFRIANEKKTNRGTLLATLELPGEPVVTLADIDSGLRTLKDDQFSHFIGVSLEPTTGTLIYANWGRGNKSGGFNDIRTATQSFGAEVGDSYELGLKKKAWGGRLVFNASAFIIDYQDLQLRSFQGGRIPIFINAGQAQSKGFEASVDLKADDSLTLIGAVGYLDAAFKQFVEPGGVDLSGNRLPNAADWSLRLAADYVRPVAGLGEFYGYAEAAYTGDYFLEFRNVPNGFQKGYVLANARVGFRFDEGFGIALWARNLTNKNYRADFQGPELPAMFGGSESQVLGAPRTFGAEIEYRF